MIYIQEKDNKKDMSLKNKNESIKKNYTKKTLEKYFLSLKKKSITSYLFFYFIIYFFIFID